MPRFEIQAPDGTIYEVDAPDQASAVAGFQQFHKPRRPRFPGTPVPDAGADRQQQLENALRNADAAGDVETAKTLANEIIRTRNGSRPPRDLFAPADSSAGPKVAAPVLVEVPGVGTVEFPVGMSDEAMSAAIRKSFPQLGGTSGGTQAAPTQAFRGGVPVGGDGVTAQPAATGPRFPGTPVNGPRFPGTPVSSDDGLPPLPPGFVLEPSPPHYAGPAMNATAGANESLYGILGAPVDLVRGGMNLASRGINAVAGTDLPQIPEDSFGGSRSITSMMGTMHPALDPQNTAAATSYDRLARSTGQGVAGAMVPAGVVGGFSRAGILGSQGAATGQALFGRAGSLTEAGLGAAGGAGAAAAQEFASDQGKPLAGLAGGIAGSTLGIGGLGMFNGARRMIQPFTAGGREALAGRALAGGASNHEALRAGLTSPPDALVAGSRPTTGQMTGDLGTLAMERGAAVRQPEAFAQRRADQNEARIGAMRGIEAGGAPEKVAASVRQHLDGIEAETERLIGEATASARAQAGALGPGMAPDVAGNAMRGTVEAARAEAKRRERALWDAVDPSGTMTLGLANTRRSANDLAEELSPLAQPMTPAERQVYTAIGQAGDQVPLRAMQELQSHLKAAMRAERSTNGESPAYRRLAIVAAGISRDFDDAVAGRVAQEAQAVRRGQMTPEETLLARWEANFTAKQQQWLGARSAAADGAGGGTLAGGNASRPAASIPGMDRAANQAAGRFGGAPGYPGLSGDAGGPSFDAAALGRLRGAQGATRERVGTFDNDTLRPFRDRPSTASPYDTPSGLLPQRIFGGGRGSFEAIGQLRAAVGQEAADSAIEGYAVGEVLRHAGRADGMLDEARLNTWRRSHADALRALPALDAKLADAGRASAAIADVAAARKAAGDAARKGALGRLVVVDAPEDVTRIVGGVFSAQDAAGRMRSIRRAIGSDPEALKGLRRAVVEHMAGRFVGTVEAGSSGLGGIKADGFQTFVRQSGTALREAGFTEAELGTLRAIGDDLQRAGRSIAAVKNPGGSDTAQNLYRLGKDGSPFGAMARMLLAPGGAGIGIGLTSGSTAGIAAGAATAAFGAMRQAGLRSVQDLVDDALLNPERARLLLEKVKPGEEASRWRALARSYGQSAVRVLAQEGDQEGLNVTIRPPRADRSMGPRTNARPLPFPSFAGTRLLPRGEEPQSSFADLPPSHAAVARALFAGRRNAAEGSNKAGAASSSSAVSAVAEALLGKGWQPPVTAETKKRAAIINALMTRLA